MENIGHWFKLISHPNELLGELDVMGIGALYFGVALIVFLETGAMVFFLPGDSLLVTAGLFAAGGHVDLTLLNVILIPAAILGSAIAYFIGKKSGPHLFNRPRSRFFRPEMVKKAHSFYEHHGGKAIVIARFMPIVRTFVPVAAGIAQMTYADFMMYNVVGGAAWVLSMTVIGFGLGHAFPDVINHLEGLIAAVVLLSITPGVVEYIRARRRARAAATSE